MRHSGQPKLIDHVMGATIPMRGRMIHGRRPNGDLYEEAQDYDVHGRAILAIDRGGLNKRLLDILEEMPNVTFFFNHKLVGADFRKNKAWFEVHNKDTSAARPPEIEVDFDFMIGADGAHSAVRYHMMKYTRMNYEQQYIDTLWCEFQIQPEDVTSRSLPTSKFRISPNHLHIWPGRDFMFIAIPSEDGSFTCTLFAPAAFYETLESDPDRVPAAFDKHFPGVTSLISPDELIDSFKKNPHLPLISIKCQPHHFSSSVVIVGDAAHAMVPFYGQGMNAGLEDVRILFDILDKHSRAADTSLAVEAGEISPAVARASQRELALAEYSAVRVPDAHAINELALQNYVEMRASVLSPTYRLRKALEEWLSVYVPSLGWQTKYSRVSFGNERYSEVVAKSERQGRLLVKGLSAGIWLPLIAGGIAMYLRHRRSIATALRAMIGSGTLYMMENYL